MNNGIGRTVLRRNTAIALLAGILNCILCPPVLTADDSVTPFSGYQKNVKPFILEHCVGCHGPKISEGDMRLDTLSSGISDASIAETWQEVLDVLNAGEMPPEDEPQPEAVELASVIGALTDGLYEARKRLVDSRDITLRRLNRREYANTIRDLLGVPVDITALPADGSVEGFDTIGDAHFMSTVQFEKYLELGREAIDRALVNGPAPKRGVNRIEPETSKLKTAKGAIERGNARIVEYSMLLKQPNLAADTRTNTEKRLRKTKDDLQRAQEYLSQPAADSGFILDITQSPFGGQGHDKVSTSLPAERAASIDGAEPKSEIGRPIGRYVVRFRAGLTCKPKPGRRLFVRVIRTDQFSQQVSYLYPLGTFEITQTMDNCQVIEVPFENFGEQGDRLAVVVSEMNIDPHARPFRGSSTLADSTKKAFVWIDWLEVEGPFIDQWPPAAWKTTFFNGLPNGEVDESAYAREIIQRFATRAFRGRAPTDEYITKVHAIFSDYRSDGEPFVDSVKEALAVVLASPSFVYLVEPRADSGTRKLSDHELASRLSYFLWSHPPDAELYRLASANKLSDPETLRRQVDRLLKDDRASAFYSSFTSQWLDLPWLDMIVVDKRRFREFNEEVREAMRGEPVHFFSTLIKENLSARNLIGSDFVVINEVLSQYYGIDNATSQPGYQRVQLPANSRRGGLLGQGAILTMTSTGERTSPVERGVFVYERLLGKSVPPPPPNVPQLEISSEKPLTVRETLAAHMTKAQCASCHRRTDPLGFALEHFDAVGRWRDEERVFLVPSKSNENGPNRRTKVETIGIDASGTMPDGVRTFDGHKQLKQHLRQDVDQMAGGLLRSLLTYALGRRVGFADGDFVARMKADWKDDDYGMRALIHAIVQSEEFQTK